MPKLIAIFMLFFLVACNTNSSPDPSNDQKQAEPSKLSASSIPDQLPSKQAKNTLRKYDETTNIYAVNTDKKILIALEVHHHDRMKLAKLKKKLAAKIEKQFPAFKTEVSTDQKLVIELNKLEKKVSQRNISNKKLKKEIKHLIQLSHEKT